MCLVASGAGSRGRVSVRRPSLTIANSGNKLRSKLSASSEGAVRGAGATGQCDHEALSVISLTAILVRR